MLRLTELKLPLDHDEAALPALIVKTLGITPAELASHHIHKRSYDARKQKLLKQNVLLFFLGALQIGIKL